MFVHFLLILAAVGIVVWVLSPFFVTNKKISGSWIMPAFALLGLGLFAGGISRHLRGDDSQHRGGRAGTYWYQEVAAGALMLGAAAYSYFSSDPTDREKKP